MGGAVSANAWYRLILAIGAIGLAGLLVTSPNWSRWIDTIGEPTPVMIRECGERTLA